MNPTWHFAYLVLETLDSAMSFAWHSDLPGGCRLKVCDGFDPKSATQPFNMPIIHTAALVPFRVFLGFGKVPRTRFLRVFLGLKLPN
jgi:hypothetical protein